MRNKKVTISDIASNLNVSTVSVSRALSGKAGVGEELKEKIVETAKELGYRLKSADTPRLLVLHAKPLIQDNSNFTAMVQGIESAVQKAGADYSIEFVGEECHRELLLPHRLSRGEEFDGAVFIGNFHTSYVTYIRRHIPALVHFTGYTPAYDIDSVWFNFNNSGYRQCDYLIGKGHRRIGFFGELGAFKNKEKLLGITTALEERGIPALPQFYIDTADYADKLKAVLSRKDKPTAIIGECDVTAVELLKFLHGIDIKVPGDISVISSGNIEISAYTIPPLTTMDLNIQYACDTAVTLLLERICDGGMPVRCVLIAPEFIERDSIKPV